MTQPVCTYYDIPRRTLSRLIFELGEKKAMNKMMKIWQRAGCPIDRDDDVYTHRDGWERSSMDDGWGNVVFEWRIKEETGD